ncbi:hypothetical protein Poli38472_009070 [Pythium oligandrum]|uniref:Uncharacterized protein n=1 Tax=Pythium oligandrum TaxID=41045 RepID=A0A8K1FNR8_PYTOL|nr:hypothetical protein Poli38472_009070 [Pythium oligandrum]|eukprot:TMW64903.1 hypothetical protein Poli38472_009070 [Pythium oligandrum]
MPASKKRIQLRGDTSSIPQQSVPAALREWVHVWHGVQVHNHTRTPDGHADPKARRARIFHSGSRLEELSIWKRLVRLPSNSLFTSVETVANPRRRYKDMLYVLLNMRWATLMLVLLAIFVGNIAIFTLLVHYACGDPDTLLKAFNLSYQTFSTIGFGIIYPKTTCSNLIMVVESFASMLITSALTGLIFAKFAKPKAKVAFSKVCVVQPYGKKYLALVVRVANATQSKDVTHDVIMEANFRVNLLRIERKRRQKRVPIGDVLCSYNLKLLQNNFITFRMGIAVVHVIDENSPLFGMSEADLQHSDMIIEVSMSGVDATLQDTVSERYTYTSEDFRWGYRFAELLDFDERRAEVVMDFSKLSTIEPAAIDDQQYVATAAEVVESSKPAYFTAVCREVDNHLYPDGTPTSSTDGETFFSQEHDRAALCERDDIVLHAIDELSPDDIPETRLRREPEPTFYGLSPSTSSSYSGPKLLRRPSMSWNLSAGMEPLFEPLLQQSVGTQRLPHESHSSDAAPNATSGILQPLRKVHRTDSGSIGASEGLPAAPDEPPVEYVIPIQQKRQLQDKLAGGELERDLTRTLSKHADENAFATEADFARMSNANQSVASIDVQDTPRFLKIAPINIPKSYDFMRIYYRALYERWPKITLVFVLVFFALNIFFAVLYWLSMSKMIAYPDLELPSFEIAFYMSVHTLATIGYGSIAPDPTSAYINFWVFVETSLGIITVTIITGIAWSKFARPRAHIHFSSRICITNIYGHRCLVFRAANTRHSGDVHENFFRIGVILTNRKTGLRQLYDVPLVRAEWPSIKLPATLIHIIDAKSPFHKFECLEDLSESRVAVIALLTGLDTTFSENVYARKMYFWDDFAFNMRFADFAVLARDHIEVDFSRFDALDPAHPPTDVNEPRQCEEQTAQSYV